MKLLLLVLAVVGVLCVPCAGQKKGKAVAKKVLPYVMAENDLRAYILGYDSTKGEFEKSTAFEARLQAMRENKPSLCFLISEYTNSNEYNADSEELSVSGGNGSSFSHSPYFKDTSIICVGEGVSHSSDYATFWDDYTLKVTNIEAVSDLGLKQDRRALSVLLPVPSKRAAYAKKNFAFILCATLIGQDKTSHLIVDHNLAIGGAYHSNAIFVAYAKITGFKVIDIKTNKVILEKYLQQ